MSNAAEDNLFKISFYERNEGDYTTVPSILKFWMILEKAKISSDLLIKVTYLQQILQLVKVIMLWYFTYQLWDSEINICLKQ